MAPFYTPIPNLSLISGVGNAMLQMDKDVDISAGKCAVPMKLRLETSLDLDSSLDERKKQRSSQLGGCLDLWLAIDWHSSETHRTAVSTLVRIAQLAGESRWEARRHLGANDAIVATIASTASSRTGLMSEVGAGWDGLLRHLRRARVGEARAMLVSQYQGARGAMHNHHVGSRRREGWDGMRRVWISRYLSNYSVEPSWKYLGRHEGHQRQVLPRWPRSIDRPYPTWLYPIYAYLLSITVSHNPPAYFGIDPNGHQLATPTALQHAPTCSNKQTSGSRPASPAIGSPSRLAGMPCSSSGQTSALFCHVRRTPTRPVHQWYPVRFLASPPPMLSYHPAVIGLSALARCERACSCSVLDSRFSLRSCLGRFMVP